MSLDFTFNRISYTKSKSSWLLINHTVKTLCPLFPKVKKDMRGKVFSDANVAVAEFQRMLDEMMTFQKRDSLPVYESDLKE